MICIYCNQEMGDDKREILSHKKSCISFQKHKEYIEKLLTKDNLYELYVNQRGSINELKEEFCVSGKFISSLLKKHNIEKRGISESTKNPRRQEKIKETNLERYGTENVLSRGSKIREEMEKKLFEKYGIENIFQLEEVKEKIRNTCIELYGVDHGMKSDINKEEFKEILSQITDDEGKEIIEKRKQTSLEKYGTEFPTQSEEVKEKTKQTNLEKYGTLCPMNSEEIIENIKQTNLEKYGVESPMQNEEVKEKTKQTNLERHGVEFGFLKGCENRLTIPHKKVVEILNEGKVDYKVESKIDKFFVDILINDYIVIEVLGDYGHANPNFYTESDIILFPEKERLVHDIGEKDKKRKEIIESEGYLFYEFWECDINGNINGVKDKLKEILKENIHEDQVYI